MKFIGSVIWAMFWILYGAGVGISMGVTGWQLGLFGFGMLLLMDLIVKVVRIIIQSVFN